MTRIKTLLALVALAAAAGRGAEAQTAAGGFPLTRDHPCAASLDSQLQFYGLALDEMRNPEWRAQNFPGGATAEGWWFTGQPPQCDSGGIAASFWADCRLIELYTTGACPISGLPAQTY